MSYGIQKYFQAFEIAAIPKPWLVANSNTNFFRVWVWGMSHEGTSTIAIIFTEMTYSGGSSFQGD